MEKQNIKKIQFGNIYCVKCLCECNFQIDAHKHFNNVAFNEYVRGITNVIHAILFVPFI